MSTINPVSSVPNVPAGPNASTASLPSSSQATPAAQDAIELSLAGRIALGVGNGKLTTQQAQELTSQLKTIHQTLQSGGTDVTQLESQLSQQIYGDAHNGASIPTNLNLTTSELRDFLQAGRIAIQEGAGNLTSAEASQFYTAMGQIYQNSQSGTSASDTNQAQNQLSVEIYNAAHNVNNPASGS